MNIIIIIIIIISSYLSLTTVWVLVGWRLVFPNWQYVYLTLSQLETSLGLFTSNFPFLVRKRTRLNPIWPRRECHYNGSIWVTVWFLFCLLVSKMAASRMVVHCWSWGSWYEWFGRLFRRLYYIVIIWRSGCMWYPFTLGLTINSANLYSP